MNSVYSAPHVLQDEPLGTENRSDGTHQDDLQASDTETARESAGAVEQSAKIMVVDDEPLNIKVVCAHLRRAGYKHFAETTNPTEALVVMQRERPDLLLLDIMMPGVSGLEILQHMRSIPQLADIPVIILTAVDDRNTKAAALNLGATDFLTKPLDTAELQARVRNVLAVKSYQDQLRNHARHLEEQVQQRTSELELSRLEVIHCLGRAAEYRDNETGRHVVRVGKYAAIIAEELGLDAETVELIRYAAPLHDVGKIAIPDSILLKPGKLTPDEFEMMQKHCGYGKKVFEPMSMEDWRAVAGHTSAGADVMRALNSPILNMAATIALTHHEKWDGSGYPLGLSGENIPLEGRITAVADVFDGLSSKRPYKPPFPLEKCFAIIKAERGKHFDPNVVDAFFVRKDDIVRIQIADADVE